MRVLIVDDEPRARARVRQLLAGADDVQIVGEASTGREAVAAIKRLSPDVVFLDIQMPGLDGFGALEALGADDAPHVVFVTADDRSAIRAFEVGAVDYLLKPFTPSRFEQVLDRARERIGHSESALVSQARTDTPAQAFLRRMFVLENGRAVFLAVNRIDRIEAERNYVNLFSERKPYRLRATIASVQARLDPSQFLRINRSTLVRLDAVKDIHEWSHGD
ncbi:MAG: LytR/AlgR family response regulator transcription factor, partial [Gemmatimonadales bacterium]